MAEVELDRHARLSIEILHFAMQAQVEGVDLSTVLKLDRVEPSRHSEGVNRYSQEAPATLCIRVRRGNDSFDRGSTVVFDRPGDSALHSLLAEELRHFLVTLQ